MNAEIGRQQDDLLSEEEIELGRAGDLVLLVDGFEALVFAVNKPTTRARVTPCMRRTCT